MIEVYKYYIIITMRMQQ